MLHNPYKIVKMFEEEVADYTGAPYAVSVDSCTNAIFLSLMYWRDMIDEGIVSYTLNREVVVPKRTYLSVPQSVMHAGMKVRFEDIKWSGCYQLLPTPVWDSAKRLSSGMYIKGQFMCLSFHIKKLLSIGKGGMILLDNSLAYEWLIKARYEGRSQKNYKQDDVRMLGWNMYMTPQQAAHGLALMQNYPKHVPDMGEDGGYRDLTEFSLFAGPSRHRMVL
jgi:dTDP-4-amino-4,6-dideoxygalactose transaminase